MRKVSAKKGLGQHFLTDPNIARKIVDALPSGEYGTIIEIGPGTGVLTGLLIGRYPQNLVAVELDHESIDFLQKEYPEHNQKFLHGDILTYDLSRHKSPMGVIGNLPYYISSQIFFRIIEFRDQVDQAVCMIQKEVADRLASPPGNKRYGILSVLLQAYFDIEYLFTVHEHCFSPPPRVKSAVIRLSRNDRKALICDHPSFHKVVKAAFNQRRKVIRNSLKSIFINLPLESELLSKRPEQLTVDQFAELTLLLQKLNP